MTFEPATDESIEIFTVKNEKSEMLSAKLKDFQDRRQYSAGGYTYYTGFDGENAAAFFCIGERKDSEIWCVIRSHKSRENLKDVLASLFLSEHDERKSTEEKAQLERLFHQLKNHLIALVSLLNQQEFYAAGKERADELRTARRRVTVLSLAYEHLYRSAVDFNRIDLTDYLKDLMQKTIQIEGLSDIEMTTDMPQIRIFFEDALPIGYITNEIVSNSCRHAFGAIERKAIRLCGRYSEGRLRLEFGDNGCGFKMDGTEKSSLGLTLAGFLIEQLDGKAECLHEDGTLWKIEVKITA